MSSKEMDDDIPKVEETEDMKSEAATASSSLAAVAAAQVDEDQDEDQDEDDDDYYDDDHNNNYICESDEDAAGGCESGCDGSSSGGGGCEDADDPYAADPEYFEYECVPLNRIDTITESKCRRLVDALRLHDPLDAVYLLKQFKWNCARIIDMYAKDKKEFMSTYFSDDNNNNRCSFTSDSFSNIHPTIIFITSS